MNTPLAAGDDIYAGKRGNLEVEIGPRAFVRAGPGTEVGLESLETGFVQFKVPSGQAAFDLQRMPEGQRVEVDTPSGAFTIDRAGYYRTDVDDHGTTFITRRGGDATVIPSSRAVPTTRGRASRRAAPCDAPRSPSNIMVVRIIARPSGRRGRDALLSHRGPRAPRRDPGLPAAGSTITAERAEWPARVS